MSAPVDRARWDELMRDQAAAALAGGIIAALGCGLPISDAVAIFDAVRAQLYPEPKP